MPTVVDPTNPLGLTAASPGYLPADQRDPQRDPDLGWSDGMVQGYTGLPDTRTPEQKNADQQPLIDWGNMDSDWAKTQLQSPTPLLLGALAAIAAPWALSALGVGAGAGAGALGGGSAAGAAGAGAGAGALGAGAAGTTAAGAGALGAGALAGNTVSDLIVTAAANGLSAAQIAGITGLSAAAVGSVIANSGAGGANSLTGNAGNDTVSGTDNTAPVDNSNVVSPLEVTAAGGSVPSGLTPLALATTAAGLGVTPPTPVSSVNPSPTPDNPTTVTDQTPDLGPYVGAGVLAGVPAAVGANGGLGDSPLGRPATPFPLTPSQILQLAPIIAGVVGGAAGGGGSFTVPTGNGAPGTLGSLSPIFSSGGLPVAAPRTQSTLPNIDWKRYAIDGPEQSFFSNVPQSTQQFAVAGPAQVPDLAALKKKFGVHGFAKGGRTDFAVHGAGDGRSDSIRANLSDGEYVFDAESVSMLGNGSSKAGAQKLDQLRVNLRKHKGKQLARGRFSVSAKDPETYMSGGRV